MLFARAALTCLHARVCVCVRTRVCVCVYFYTGTGADIDTSGECTGTFALKSRLNSR